MVVSERAGAGRNDRFRTAFRAARLVDSATGVGRRAAARRQRATAGLLKWEYGTDGKGFVLDGTRYALWFDENGLRLSPGKSAQGVGAATLSWADAAERIGQLLEQGAYVPQPVLDRAGEVERTGLAERLLYLFDEFSDEAREAGYMPTVREMFDNRDGLTATTEQLANELTDNAFIQRLVDEMQTFFAALAKDPSLLRFRMTSLGEQAIALTGLLRQRISYPAPGPITAEPAPEQFITDDEIDKLMFEGSHSSHGKLRISRFFLAEHTKKERIEFLKKEYGTGGWCRAGFNETHSAGNGIEYMRSYTLGAPEAKVHLTWEQAEARIGELVRRERYLTDADMPRFDSIAFEKLLPHEMRFKEADLVNGDEVYWVTQEPFSLEQLREFQQAVRDYTGDIQKFYVTCRDLSYGYNFEEDLANKILAVVTPLQILDDDYIRAMQDEGLDDFLKQEEQDVSPAEPVTEMPESKNGQTVSIMVNNEWKSYPNIEEAKKASLAASIPERLTKEEAELSTLEQQEQNEKAELGTTFPQEQELEEKTARLIELDAELDMGDEQKTEIEEHQTRRPKPVSL